MIGNKHKNLNLSMSTTNKLKNENNLEEFKQFESVINQEYNIMNVKNVNQSYLHFRKDTKDFTFDKQILSTNEFSNNYDNVPSLTSLNCVVMHSKLDEKLIDKTGSNKEILDTISVSSNEEVPLIKPIIKKGRSKSTTKKKVSKTKSKIENTIEDNKALSKLPEDSLKTPKYNRSLRKLPKNFLETPSTKKLKKGSYKSKTEPKILHNDILENKSEVKTEEKFRKKITKSTNLKNISYKHHPPSQTKLENFFTKTPKTNSVSYYETFEKSKQQNSCLPHSTIENVDAYLDVIRNEIKIKTCVSEKSSLNNEIVCDIEIKSEKVTEVNIETENPTNFVDNNSLNIAKDNKTNIIDESCLDLQEKSEIEVPLSEAVQNSNELQKLSCISSLSYSLSETAQIHKRSSLRSSLSSMPTKSKEINNATSSKRARKRLSFRNNILHNTQQSNASDICDSLSPLVTISETSQNHQNLNMSIEFLPIAHELIELSDGDDDDDKMKILTKEPITNKNSLAKNKENKKRRKSIQCPFYKVIQGTTFSVDAFRFGDIEGVTHYFLTHFHGDHYIGLKKTFSKPIYMSSITARLVENFIHVDPVYINIIDPDESVFVNGIEVTSIDANHCPGAVMFAFKFADGKIILHTGDFRASFEMESNCYFWNNIIDTVYLDTTYLHKNYDFISQTESIDLIKDFVTSFQEKHIEKKILYVCGSYVIGKEKVWAAIAELTEQKVYTKGNRLKALQSIKDTELLKYLVDEPKDAGIHVLQMGELFYDKLTEYFKLFDEDFDILLAIRPSGWETNSKPQYRGKINIAGFEYSEHSSSSELRRFIRFLQPKNIISTVPYGTDIFKTCKIPISWFNNQVKPITKSYQPSIINFTSSAKKSKLSGRCKNDTSKLMELNESLYETAVSPIKSKQPKSINQIQLELSFEEEITKWMS